MSETELTPEEYRRALWAQGVWSLLSGIPDDCAEDFVYWELRKIASASQEDLQSVVIAISNFWQQLHDIECMLDFPAFNEHQGPIVHHLALRLFYELYVLQTKEQQKIKAALAKN